MEINNSQFLTRIAHLVIEKIFRKKDPMYDELNEFFGSIGFKRMHYLKGKRVSRIEIVYKIDNRNTIFNCVYYA